MYNHDDGVIMFTAPNWDRGTVDKCYMKPHCVLCSFDKLNLVLYSSDDDGWGLTLLHNWVSFTKILFKNNEKRGLVEAKNQKYSKSIYIGK